MPSNEKIAVAAHLHVLLRRKTGRVTDTEWMASNREYAIEIARFARGKAAEDGHVDLSVWADKLEEIMAIPDTRQRVPLVKAVTDAVKERAAHPAAGGPASGYPADQQGSRRVNTEDEVYPESGFIESTFGHIFGDNDPNRDPNRPKEKKDPDAPRYVKGLR